MNTTRKTGKSATHASAPIRTGERPKVMLYYPDFGAVGGIERMLHQTALALKARGHYEPVVVCTAESPFLRALQKSGIRAIGVKQAPLFANPNLRWLDVATQLRLRRILSRERPDLVHVHVGGPENRLFARLGYPVVYTVHGYGTLYSTTARQPRVKRLFKKLYRPAFRRSLAEMDAVIFVSESERRRMAAEGYLPESLDGTVIPNGLNVERFAARARAYPELDYEQGADECCRLVLPQHGRNARYVSFIDRIDANKNPFAFVALAERLGSQPEFADLFFLIAGKGPLEEELCMRIADSPVKGRIHFVGHTDEVPYLLSVSELVVHIPTEEGFGLGVLEAMAVGTPVLCHASGGIPELLGDSLGECMVPTGDADALARQAARLLTLDSAERHALSHRMRARAGMFDLAAMMRRLEEVYGRVLARR